MIAISEKAIGIAVAGWCHHARDLFRCGTGGCLIVERFRRHGSTCLLSLGVVLPRLATIAVSCLACARGLVCLLIPKQQQPVAWQRLTSPVRPLTCGNYSLRSVGDARLPPTLAPTLAPTRTRGPPDPRSLHVMPIPDAGAYAGWCSTSLPTAWWPEITNRCSHADAIASHLLRETTPPAGPKPTRRRGPPALSAEPSPTTLAC